MIDEETAIVMCYTGWSQEMAKTWIARWQGSPSGWSAEYMRQRLSARGLEKLKKLTGKAHSQMSYSYKRRYETSQQALAQALHENRIHVECLEIAMETLRQVANSKTTTWRYAAARALAEIEGRLTELEVEIDDDG